MTSKFTPIVKVRKQQRDAVETRLAKARFEKHELEQKIIFTCKDIEKIETPTSGDISLMRMSRERLAIIRKIKDRLEEELHIKDDEISQLRDKHKRAHLEFEKIKHLEGQDFQAWIEKAKKDEQLDMDEISNMLFANKDKN